MNRQIISIRNTNKFVNLSTDTIFANKRDWRPPPEFHWLVFIHRTGFLSIDEFTDILPKVSTHSGFKGKVQHNVGKTVPTSIFTLYVNHEN